MNAEVGIKGASRAVAGMAALLLVAMTAGCGTATVVKPSGGSSSRAAAAPRTSVPTPFGRAERISVMTRITCPLPFLGGT